MGVYTKLASGIYNDIHAGLKGLVNEWTLSIEQLEDEIVDLRIKKIQEKIDSNIRLKNQFATAIKCIPVDCKPIDNCDCGGESLPSEPMPHFVIPVPFMNAQEMAIVYIGTTDMEDDFKVLTSFRAIKALNSRRTKIRKPYVYLSPAPNKDGFIDGYIFNAPYIQQVTVIAVFKDLRRYMDQTCCEYTDSSESLNSDIAKEITAAKVQLYTANLSNDRKTVI